VLAERSLREQIPRQILDRGDDYFARGRVRDLFDEGIDGYRALVQGEKPYDVWLTPKDGELEVLCTCFYYTENLQTCKHIWAAIRAAIAKNLLPDTELELVYQELREMVFPPVRSGPLARTPQPVRPPLRLVEPRRPWERFFEAVGSAPPPSIPTSKVPQEIAYAIRPTFAPPVTMQILARARKKDGQWTKWKRLSMRLDELHHLPPFDRETISLLQARAYNYGGIDPVFPLPAETAAWWIERLARAEKLYLVEGDDALRPLRWDGGAPWKLRVAIVADQARAAYRIEGSVVRGEASLPTAGILLPTDGIIIHGEEVSALEDAGNAAWLRALRGMGSVEIPYADSDRFREVLVAAPIDGIALPEELGWQLADLRPRPHLSLRQNPFSSELTAELFFIYGEWRVPHRSIEMQKTIGRTLIRRHVSRENTFRARLGSLPAIAAWEGWKIRQPHLEEVVRTLSAEGWSIELDAAPLRIAEDVDVEISSGIDWFDLHATASFGDLRVDFPELLAAAETKQSLLRLSDGSFGIVPTNWADDLAPVLDLGKRHADGVRFHSAQAILVDALLHEKKATVDHAFAELRGKLAEITPVPRQEPPTLATELRQYQRAGLGWIEFLRTLNLGGCLADDMGLGKTVQALAQLEALRAEGNQRPSLVVAPRSLLFNWAAEAKRFAPKLRVLEYHGADRGKHADAFADHDLVLTTYATMRLDIAQIAQTEFEYVILDEAQAIKNGSSQVAKASRLLRGKHRLALSGTPIENHLGDLWSLFEFLNPGLLGSTRAFSRTFAGKGVPPERRQALARALRPLILRRTKEQVAPELPERIEQTLYCELEGKQRRDYEELREHYRRSLLGTIKTNGMAKSRMQVLEALLRLRQAACHPGLIDGHWDAPSAKLDLLLDELAEVLESGHRALVFSQFTSFLAIVRRALEEQKLDYLYLDGQTSDRQSVVQKFQSEGGPQIFLISLKAGGLGLNLTNADYIFLLDPWWNPAVEAQAIDRAHRIGRLRPVVAHRLIARDTVEEKILELQARKRELADSIISEDNSVLRGLAVEDLEMLLS
jgi:superfamily II DNA or RNA helicase